MPPRSLPPLPPALVYRLQCAKRAAEETTAVMGQAAPTIRSANERAAVDDELVAAIDAARAVASWVSVGKAMGITEPSAIRLYERARSRRALRIKAS